MERPRDKKVWCSHESDMKRPTDVRLAKDFAGDLQLKLVDQLFMVSEASYLTTRLCLY